MSNVNGPVVGWTYTLTAKGTGRALFDRISNDEAAGYFLVCWQTPKGRKFGAFSNPVHFLRFSDSLSPEERCFYEIILGTNSQKPHFDLDWRIKNEGVQISDEELHTRAEALKDHVIDGILSVFNEEYGIPLDLSSEIAVYNSHGPRIRSYHIVIPNYSTENNKESEHIYKLIADKLTDDERIHFDAGVYKNHQQFRLLWNHKLNDNRDKILQPSFQFHGKSIRYLSRNTDRVGQFLESLVCYSMNAFPLTPFGQEQDNSNGISIEIDDPVVTGIIQLLVEIGGVKKEDLPYQVREVSENIIILNRIRPSFCRICQRVHESENPYICLIENPLGFYDAFFDCRRSEPKKYLHLGSIQVEPTTETSSDRREDPKTVNDTSVKQNSNTNKPLIKLNVQSQGSIGKIPVPRRVSSMSSYISTLNKNVDIGSTEQGILDSCKKSTEKRKLGNGVSVKVVNSVVIDLSTQVIVNEPNIEFQWRTDVLSRLNKIGSSAGWSKKHSLDYHRALHLPLVGFNTPYDNHSLKLRIDCQHIPRTFLSKFVENRDT